MATGEGKGWSRGKTAATGPRVARNAAGHRGVDRTALGKPLYRVRLKDAELYRWLIRIGLTPKESLTLGGLSVPDEHLAHVVRGLLDGDGTILNFTSKVDTTRRPDGSYRYEWFRADSSRPVERIWSGWPCLLRKRAIWDDYVARHAVDVARAAQIRFVSR